MSDKFRKVVPIRIAFGDGEDPSSQKVTALGDQIRNGLSLIEKAIGDVWNQSGDASLIPGGNLFQNALYVTNLGRALGSQKYLSPRIPYLSGILKYSDAISQTASQLTQLKYKPVPASPPLVTGDFTVSGVAPGGALTTFKATPDLVQAAGDWHVTSSGMLITFTPITAATLEYKPLPAVDIDTTTTAAVIPDPYSDTALSTTNFMGLKLAYANNTDNSTGYWLYLPPRKPLTIPRTIPQSPLYAGNNVDPTSGVYFFQGSGFNAATGANGVHYRYKFPAEVQTLINASVAITIPDNFMYLMDANTGTIVEGLTFSVDTAAPLWAVKVSGAKLDQIVAELSLTPDVGYVSLKATETAAAYKSRFKLMGPGASLAKNLSALTGNFSNHIHSGIDGSTRVKHSDLIGLFANNINSWSPSFWTADDHPQYLHRDGYNAGTRDVYKNGMLGDLLLLSTTNASNYFNITADSNKLLFGGVSPIANTPSIHFKQSTPAITVTNADLDVTTAGAKLKFEASTTTYLNKTRLQSIIDALQMQRVVFNSIGVTSALNMGAYYASYAPLTFTIPAGMTAYVSLHVSLTYHWSVPGGGRLTVGISSSLSLASPLGATTAEILNASINAIGTTYGAGPLAAGTYTYYPYWKNESSTGTLTEDLVYATATIFPVIP